MKLLWVVYEVEFTVISCSLNDSYKLIKCKKVGLLQMKVGITTMCESFAYANKLASNIFPKLGNRIGLQWYLQNIWKLAIENIIVWFMQLNWSITLFPKYVIELTNVKSNQSYMSNVNYDIFCEAKNIFRIDLRICNSMNS